jgi:[ribosomal protein S5]-alanine N-acetyltransferase
VNTLTTDRLLLRQPLLSDAGFILRLLNDPDWLRYIGDRSVRSEADAQRYISERLLESFRSQGFGLWVIQWRDQPAPLGLCGLLRRDSLADVDIGFALLPEARGLGIAREAALRTLQFAKAELGLRRVVAITKPANSASAGLLQRLGLCFERIIEHEGGDSLCLYGIELAQREV